MPSTKVHILLVEDDDVDSEAIQRSFRRNKIANPIYRVTDGQEALAALRGEDGHPRLPRPYMILLDINMPRMNGLEFLQTLRQDPELQQSIVFVLTTSDRDEDRFAAYSEHVAGYILKRHAGENFVRLLTMLRNYWLVVELPGNPPSIVN
jgi:CheY-like chemotaxis protein